MRAPTRVQVQGDSGSGKSTLAARLSVLLDAPHVELDALVHGSGWTETSDDALRELLEPLLARERWVVDGNYARKLGAFVSERADLVVWLDVPLRVSLVRVTRRSVRLIRSGSELWNGNRQTWRGLVWGRDSLIAYSVRTHRRARRHILATVAPEKLVRLRSDAEVERWLRSL